LIYLLALATTEQPPSCRRRVIQTPPSSDIKIARLRFLFVLRLRTGIDLRDQVDLAPARLVTVGSWFSDCIGASSLARRSRIVRVNNHQIGFISTHRNIGHSPSINTTLLLSGIADLESRVVEMANQGTGSLFTGAEILANLARCSCSIPCIKPLLTIVKIVEVCVIFNFALDHKVHFSLKIQRKFILKTASAN
jgi:hypothetical protein